MDPNAEQDLTVQDDSTPEERQEAARLGWADKSRWKGNPDEWIDAKEFLRRGREVLPILKSTNQKLSGELDLTKQQTAHLAEQLRQTQAALKALEEAQEEQTQERHEEELDGIEAQIEQASADGDHRRVAKLTRQMTEMQLKAREKSAERNGSDQAADRRPQIPPEVRDWFTQNDRYAGGKYGALLGAEMAEMRKGGDTRKGVEFLEEARARVEEFLGETGGAGGSSRVSGDNGGSGRRDSRNNGTGKSYADLPKEAKDYAERSISRFVGPGKKYKTPDEWRKGYAKSYWSQEQAS